MTFTLGRGAALMGGSARVTLGAALGAAAAIVGSAVGVSVVVGAETTDAVGEGMGSGGLLAVGVAVGLGEVVLQAERTRTNARGPRRIGWSAYHVGA
jgi:hypothetical protein